MTKPKQSAEAAPVYVTLLDELSATGCAADYPAPETEVVNVWKIACDGGEGALGHPRIWIAIPQDEGVADCGYCDKRYINENFIEKLKG